MKLFYSYSILAILIAFAPNLLAQEETDQTTTPEPKVVIEDVQQTETEAVSEELPSEDLAMSELDEAFTENDAEEKTKVFDKSELEEVAYYYRHHKRLPAIYEGFAIELTTSDLPLKRNYFLFNQFGNISVEKLKEGGYAYLIKVEFTKRETAENFVKNIILHRAPEAKVVEYVNGVRDTK